MTGSRYESWWYCIVGEQWDILECHQQLATTELANDDKNKHIVISAVTVNLTELGTR